MRRTAWKLVGIVLTLAIAATLVATALAGGSKKAAAPVKSVKIAKAQRSHANAAPARKLAGDSTDPADPGAANESSTSESSATAESDGVEQSGNVDHQCPPACSPGEQP